MRIFADGYFDVGMHYRRPVGIMGRIAGKRMAEQHMPENAWTVSLLRAQAGDQVLEIGFGPGIAIQRLLKLVPGVRVAGVDFSRTMVHMARKSNLTAVKSGRLDLRYGDAATLPFKDGTFDKVFSIHSLYFWPEPARVLTEIVRVLKPGGSLVLTLLPREKWPGGTGSEICRVYSAEDITKLMTDAGMSSTSIERGSENKKFREVAVVGRK